MSILNSLTPFCSMNCDTLARDLSRHVQKASVNRGYDAAKINRLTSSWIMSATSADAEIWSSLSALRGRMRELSRNNDYARRFLKLCSMNIVGPNGIGLRMKIKDPRGNNDTGANKIIQDAWKDWSRRCTLDGKLSLPALSRLNVETTAQDGEIIIRKIKGPDAGNKYNFALQPLEADHLDEQFNDPNRNIRMGIEYNDLGRPVAYWLFKQHPGDTRFNQYSRDRIRVPADEIIHLYIKERPSQSRGITWMHTAANSMRHIDGYAEAEIVAARTAASKMGLITTEAPDGWDGEEDDDGNYITEAEPGTFDKLPVGSDFKMYDPTHPAGNFDPFLKSMLRKTSSGLLVSNAALTGDLSSANYSSLRSGSITENDMWMILQSWYIDDFQSNVFEDWLDTFLLSGLSNLPYSKYDKFNAPQWMPRRWKWVDPLKDQQATIDGINNALTSRAVSLADQGLDFEELVEQLAYEQQLLDKYGIKITPAAKQAPQQESEGGQDVGKNN